MIKGGFVIFLLLILQVGIIFAIEPFGANISVSNTGTAPADTPIGIPAIAGNVTELNVFGFSTTQSWQGYVGNVTGTIQLSDSSDNTLYNWSLASPQGEIYASTNDSVNWQYIQCFNFTSTGTYADDTPQAGSTSLHGTNLTQLELAFNIATDDVDGIDETFSLLGSGHNNFYTNNLQFSLGECPNTRVFSDAGQGEEDKFEEALLYEPVSRSVIFTSILNENLVGFDNSPHDFEMLVLEDGHNTDISTTNYYFYVELE